MAKDLKQRNKDAVGASEEADDGRKKRKDTEAGVPTAAARRFACRLKQTEVTRLNPNKVVSAERAEILALDLGCPTPPEGGAEVAIH